MGTGVRLLCGYDGGIYEALSGEGGGGNVCPSSFKPVISHFKRKPCCFWYFTILIALFSVTLSLIAFSTHLCVVSPFLLCYVAISRRCRLQEFDPIRAIVINSIESLFLHDCVLCPPFFFKVVLPYLFELLHIFCGNRNG